MNVNIADEFDMLQNSCEAYGAHKKAIASCYEVRTGKVRARSSELPNRRNKLLSSGETLH